VLSGEELVASIPLSLGQASAPRRRARRHARGQRGNELVEDAADMPGEAHLERAVPPELLGIAVDHDDARILGKARRPPIAEAEVERRAEHEDEVGVGQRPPARVREGGRVIRRQRAPARPVHEDGDARGLREARERWRGGVPVDAAARDHERALGPRDQLNEPVDVGRIGERGTPVHVGAGDRREAGPRSRSAEDPRGSRRRRAPGAR
jgi:hypothetical protein